MRENRVNNGDTKIMNAVYLWIYIVADGICRQPASVLNAAGPAPRRRDNELFTMAVAGK